MNERIPRSATVVFTEKDLLIGKAPAAANDSRPPATQSQAPATLPQTNLTTPQGLKAPRRRNPERNH